MIGNGMFDPDGPKCSKLHLFRRGLIVALVNPKSILFFTALFVVCMSFGRSPQRSRATAALSRVT